MTRAFRILEELQTHRNALEAEIARRRREQRDAGNGDTTVVSTSTGTSEGFDVVDQGIGRIESGFPPTTSGSTSSTSRIPGAMDDLD